VDNSRSHRDGLGQPVHPAERVFVRRDISGRQKAVNDNTPSLAWRMFRALRWAVILAVAACIAWSLFR
jgi:hypothetical protein